MLIKVLPTPTVWAGKIFPRRSDWMSFWKDIVDFAANKGKNLVSGRLTPLNVVTMTVHVKVYAHSS